MQDLFNQRHGLQTRPSSALHNPPFAVVRVPSMVNPDPARFHFFVSMCGPTPGSAVFSISSTSLAFALSSAASLQTSSSAPLPSAGPWPTSSPPPFSSAPPPDGPSALGTVCPAQPAPVPPPLTSIPPLAASSPLPESSDR